LVVTPLASASLDAIAPESFRSTRVRTAPREAAPDAAAPPVKADPVG
jgi:hypothetical protein